MFRDITYSVPFSYIEVLSFTIFLGLSHSYPLGNQAWFNFPGKIFYDLYNLIRWVPLGSQCTMNSVTASISEL